MGDLPGVVLGAGLAACLGVTGVDLISRAVAAAEVMGVEAVASVSVDLGADVVG